MHFVHLQLLTLESFVLPRLLIRASELRITKRLALTEPNRYPFLDPRILLLFGHSLPEITLSAGLWRWRANCVERSFAVLHSRLNGSVA